MSLGRGHWFSPQSKSSSRRTHRPASSPADLSMSVPPNPPWTSLPTVYLSDSLRTLPQVPIDDYRRNLASILSTLRTSFPSARLLLLAPTILDPAAWLAFRRAAEPAAPKDRSVEAQKAYADACLAVGREEGVLCVDQHTAMQGAVERGEVEPKDVLSDGLHLTTRGYEVGAVEEMDKVHADRLCPAASPRSSTPSCAKRSTTTFPSSGPTPCPRRSWTGIAITCRVQGMLCRYKGGRFGPVRIIDMEGIAGTSGRERGAREGPARHGLFPGGPVAVRCQSSCR